MKPVYSFDKEYNCGIIDYNNKKYYVDINDRDNIINFNKKFMFNNEDDLYPSYNYNKQTINYLMFLYNFKENNVNYIFKNNNPFDLRRNNVEIYHIYHKQMITKYNVIEYISGHYSKHGCEPYHMKNPIWKINDESEYLLMYCEKNTIIKLCQKSLDKIIEYENAHNEGKKLTFHKHTNGYILSSKSLFIHQIITGCYGNGKGTITISVDHINQNPLDNTWINLRISTREEQEQNSKGIKPGTKRERKHNAKPLPEGITQNMMKKYVVFYEDYANKEKTRLRQYFKIEKHPKLEKIIIGCKSNKISILEKLNEINKIIDDLDNDNYIKV
jgi:hypothetical protein